MIERLLEPVTAAQVLVTAMLAICFLQSGVDKVLDFKGNLAWLNGHFAKTPMRGQVAPMLAVIMLLECAADSITRRRAPSAARAGFTAISS